MRANGTWGSVTFMRLTSPVSISVRFMPHHSRSRPIPSLFLAKRKAGPPGPDASTASVILGDHAREYSQATALRREPRLRRHVHLPLPAGGGGCSATSG